MLTVEMTSMPASSSSSTSCQRFSFREPGTLVCASSSTNATLGLAREDRVDVHLLEVAAAVRRRACRGTTSRSPICSAVVGRPCVSTKPTTTSVPRSGAPAALVEHRERLARRRAPPRGRCEVCRGSCDQPTETLDDSSARVEGEVELEHVHRGSPRTPSVRRVVCSSTRRVTAAIDMPRALATRGAWSRALATEMCGSSPEPEAVTASTGTDVFGASPFSLRYAAARSLTDLISSGLVGAEVGSGARGAVVAVGARGRRARVEVLRLREGLTDQLRSDRLAVALDERAVGLVVEQPAARCR